MKSWRLPLVQLHPLKPNHLPLLHSELTTDPNLSSIITKTPPNTNFLQQLSSEQSTHLLSLIMNDPTVKLLSICQSLATNGNQVGNNLALSKNLDSARKEAYKNIADAGVLTTIDSIGKPIHNWKTDVLTLAEKYPFKGKEAIKLPMKVVQGQMWNEFYNAGVTKDPADHPLEYFLDQVFINRKSH